jgi:hypothetical protein
MDFATFSIFAVILVSLTSLLLLITVDWRLSVLLLATQYIGVTLLVAVEWPLEMAITKLIAGWMSGAILGMAIVSVPELRRTLSAEKDERNEEELLTSERVARLGMSRLFYLLAAILVGLAVLSQAQHVVNWIPGIEPAVIWGGMILIGMGLLKLGFTNHPLPTILALLTALAGFEILYAAIETAALIAGLLAGVNLGLALIGAYLLVAPYMEEAE